MLAGITNKSIQLSDVDDVFVSPNKRRKGNASHKCKSEFPINDIVDTIEPINLTHKIEDENQQFKESDNISLPSSISNFQLSLAAQLQNVDFNTNVNTTPEVTTRQSIPFVLPFLPRRFPFLLPFENLTTGNKAETTLEQKPKSSHLYHEFAQVSKSFSFSPCGTVNKNTFASKENSSVLQLLHSCLEQIPLPPIGSDCQEILNSLYTYTIFQAINFQKSVLRYLTELNEKTRPRPSEPKNPWNLHFNDKSLQPNLYAFSRSASSDCKSLESTLLANDSESGTAIDLRVRPPKSALDSCSINFGRATLPHDSCIQESSADCLDSSRISGFLSHAFNRRSPSLSSYPNDLSDAFPPRHLFSRFAVRSPSRCLNGRRLKTTSLKNKKPRSLGGYSPSSSTPGRDSQCSGPLLSKKPSFRGTSEEENEVCPHFKPVEQNGHIILSELHPSVMLPKEVYQSLIIKSSGSATRLIRLLMKSFFSQEELAASSLSGEGIYKQRLQPEITEAIKAFIRKRHPQLKTGSINLCMTDVCVQARRVANNQRSRVRGPKKPLSKYSTSSPPPPPPPPPPSFWSPFKTNPLSPPTATNSSSTSTENTGSNLLLGSTTSGSGSPL